MSSPPSDQPDERAGSRWERWVQAADGADPVTGILPVVVAAVGGVVVAASWLWRRVRRR